MRTSSSSTDGPDWDAIYQDTIHPRFAAPQGGADVPRCIFVVGNQGSGKSTLIDRLHADLGAERTQSIVPDALVASIEALHAEAPASVAAHDAYCRTHSAIHCQRLADHAVAQRSHILWERAIPGNIERIALALRRLGYRVECQVLATPTEESWLASLQRSLSALASGVPSAMHVGWPLLCQTALRWPVLLDRIELDLTFDRISVLSRDGDVAFDNTVDGPPEDRRWTENPFAYESLVVERAGPRSAAQLAALLADWDRLRPQIAATSRPNWPVKELDEFDTHLRALAADPGSQFDLNAPDPDPVMAKAWIARLAAQITPVQSSAEVRNQPNLAARSARLLQLVSQIAGQPTR